MSENRARVVRAEGEPAASSPLFEPGPSVSQRRRIAREEIEGRLAGERLLEGARARAETIVATAKQEMVRAAAELAREAREAADAKLAADWLALRAAERADLDSARDRVLSIAVVLAERLLGTALKLDPTRVADLAGVVLAEAHGARRAVVDAHPLDAEVLRRHLTGVKLGPEAVDIHPDDALARGELRLHTDVGTIDAKLSSRLERLAAALHDAVR